MRLERIEYSEYVNNPQEWKIIDCSFRDINLVVGKNAIGKTRTLNVIETLANLFIGKQKLTRFEGGFNVHFTNNSEPILYILQSTHDNFISEKLIINSEVYLDRGADGKGEIYAQELQRTIRFQTSVDEVAVFKRRDTIQHPFLEDFYEWGKNLLRYNFGTLLGRTHLAIFDEGTTPDTKLSEINLKETEKVVEIFVRGIEEYSSDFVDAIISDMASIDYHLDEIGVEPLKVKLQPTNLPVEPVGLYVKESDLQVRTTQRAISQGMFRALSVLIQLNYATFSSTPSCILIDDIGEGLDFDRSSSLVKLLIEKAKKFCIQLIMATNDRFIMNNVPLEYWIILNRDGLELTHYNYRNSKEIFDKFELTGLSNFDFFSSDYYLQSENGK